MRVTFLSRLMWECAMRTDADLPTNTATKSDTKPSNQVWFGGVVVRTLFLIVLTPALGRAEAVPLRKLCIGSPVVVVGTPIDPLVKTPQMLAAEADADFERKLQSLSTASALFAMADELAEKGDITKARRAYRTLMTRFPNSRLAALSAERLTSLASRGDGAAQPNRASSGGTVVRGSVRTSPNAEFASLCMRDATKLTRILQSLGTVSESTKTYRMFAQVFERCRSYDPQSDDYYTGNMKLMQATQDKGFGETYATKINFRIEEEIAKALSDPNYSAELGPVRLAPR